MTERQNTHPVKPWLIMGALIAALPAVAAGAISMVSYPGDVGRALYTCVAAAAIGGMFAVIVYGLSRV